MQLKHIAICLWALACAVSASAQEAGHASTQTARLPNPVLVFMGQEFFEAGGQQFTRYRYSVDNLSVYPDELFAASPTLPPCGSNASSSRTWVDIYDQNGKRL